MIVFNGARRSAYGALAALLLAGCQAPADGDAAINQSTNADGTSAAALNEAGGPVEPEIPLADRPAPQPIAGGKPLDGEFDPDIMQVTLAGDRLNIADAKHGWPLYVDHSKYDFARQGMGSFGTPSLNNAPDDCPAGKLVILDYPNGLSLHFQDGVLVGYWVSEGSRGVATESGIRPGSPRSALGNRKINEASFGKLVDVDGTIAVLDEKETKVTDLYFGSACIYD